MLNRIIRFSIQNKLIVWLMMVALIGAGAYSFTRLPIDAVPDITNNQVQILTTAPSQAAQEIERLVTFPIEQAVASIPGIEEVRSFSRFGLSSVTVVFKENVDIYWARQQIGERLNVIGNIIPPEFGTPVLAPVSTGLSEIYQYVIKPKPGYEQKYNETELRTIQDWIVRRQLIGVEGVADVASFGGKLKQYEITLDPYKLKSMNISITDVFDALAQNNQNTGGAYIDKKPNAYYIRSEGLVQSIKDIEQIAVKNLDNGTPVLIQNLGTVQLGFATRYGAMTYDDKGEVVGAIVLMLKGANSSEVVENVKERMAHIGKTLPEGIEIEAFLDRTKLVNNAIETVGKNLAEGALIVMFILVLFLGNLRAGLVVASVIPLSMLFAITLMNVFGVSGNLMSLGAIDFGIIVDGAVIIVEATMHHLFLRGNITLTQKQMDDEVYHSATKIRNAAAFGEIIILMVYLPIMALSGVEGKMFKPMAQTVSFAILGAFLLSLTYVPMMSALFLNKKINTRKTFADKMMNTLQSFYQPILAWATKQATRIVGFSVLLFVLSLLLFNQLGAEFLPTLDEGDFAIETRVLLGSSLTETIDAAQKSSKILKDSFPDEVEKVVGKIGTSEIPTDPMPLEACDLMVILKDKDEWTKAETAGELADKMQEILDNNPGVSYGFQQPIQMRFNELMTGARQDVVIKVYGEDLDKLKYYGEAIAKLLPNIDGARDVYVEKITGLPQIVVSYKRDLLAKFGVSIQEVNTTISSAFAGRCAGQLYEGEKRFDIVVRLDQGSRSSIEDVRNLYVHSGSGQDIPLYQLADIEFVSGPNQIQRDDAKRRIVVGLNVRGRDVESVVQEIQSQMKSHIQFEPGYYATFGGSFKNLEEARNRLLIAVPVALLLIFVLLYFTFHSVEQGLIIFAAIPLSAIGGILALWLRDMPFSISAGVGFIALFGVAVLNGIVLLAEFNRLKADGETDVLNIIKKGTTVRLRPVLMTAAVASLGFLPMALSNGSGAEVQKPLATVVIGGLVSATLLTLVVLPCLYLLVEKRKQKLSATPALMILLLLGTLSSNAQQTISLQQATDMAVQQNNKLQAVSHEKRVAEYQKRSATEIPKTDVGLMYGQYNGYYKQDNHLSVSQTIPFPGAMISRSSLGTARVKGAEYKLATTRNELILQVRMVYYTLLFLDAQHDNLLRYDSVFQNLTRIATSRYERGDGSLLEKTSAEGRLMEVRNELLNNESEYAQQQLQLQQLLNSTVLYDVDPNERKELVLSVTADSAALQHNPRLLYLRQQVVVAEKEKSATVNTSLPDIKLGYFNQTLFGVPLNDGQTEFAGASNRFQGVSVGLSFPLWFVPDVARAKAQEAQIQASEMFAKQQEQELHVAYKQAVQQYLRSKRSLAYYTNTAVPNAKLIYQQSERAFQAGEISYAQHQLNLQQSISIIENYTQTLLEYNQSIIQIEFYTAP